MENAALGNDGVIDVGGVVVSEDDGAAAESGQQILEEVEFEEIVEEDSAEDGESEKVVRDRDQRERIEELVVGIPRMFIVK